MAKRERKAWLVVDAKGGFVRVQRTKSAARFYSFHGERVVRCTVPPKQ